MINFAVQLIWYYWRCVGYWKGNLRDISERLLSFSVLRVCEWLTCSRWRGVFLSGGLRDRVKGAVLVRLRDGVITTRPTVYCRWIGGIFREPHVSKFHRTRSSSICRLPTKACCQLTEQHSFSCLFDVNCPTVALSFYRFANASDIGVYTLLSFIKAINFLCTFCLLLTIMFGRKWFMKRKVTRLVPSFSMTAWEC